MWDRFFHMYEAIKFKEFYYAAHAKRAALFCTLYSGFVNTVSIASVLAWSISKTLPVFWAILISAAQFAQSLNSLFPWYKQREALKYLLPELKKLSLAIDADYMRLMCEEDPSESDIRQLVSGYEQSFADLESQFVQDIVFPERKSVMRLAEADKQAYFYSKYPEQFAMKGGDDNHGEQQSG